MRRGRRSKYSRRTMPSNTTKYKNAGVWFPALGNDSSVGRTILQQRLQIHRIPFPTANLSLTVSGNNAVGTLYYGKRTGAQIYVSGIKYYQEFYADTTRPVVVNLAILQARQPQTITTAAVRTDFFVNPVAEQDRYIDFVDDNGSQGYLPNYKIYGINKQKYNILTHKRFILDPKTRIADLNAVGPGESYNESAVHTTKTGRISKTVNLWMPLRKVFTFDEPSDTYPQQTLFSAWWWSALNGKDYTDLSNNDEQVIENIFTNVVFRDA